MHRLQNILLFAILIVTTERLGARVNVVSLPGRDSVQLTIYNSVDLTMVRETRLLTFHKGMNRLEFSWANTLIDPTSVEFKALTHGPEVEVLDVRFPPRVSKTLEWRIQSEFGGEVKVEICYFISGISWSAGYLGEMNPREAFMNLTGTVQINNHSGEDFENAQVRLLVGTVRLVQQLIELESAKAAEAKTPAIYNEFRSLTKLAIMDAEAKDTPHEVVKESLSEYYLYTITGRDTLYHDHAKSLPSFEVKAIPVVTLFKYEKEFLGEQPVRFLSWTNNAAAKMGKEPLPEGKLMLVKQDAGQKGWEFLGQCQMNYIPIGEKADLEMAPDQEVEVKPILKDWRKLDLRFDRDGNISGWTLQESWQIELQNSKPIPLVVDARRSLQGDWTLATTEPYEKLDAGKIRFRSLLRPGEIKRIAYQTTTRYGNNANR